MHRSAKVVMYKNHRCWNWTPDQIVHTALRQTRMNALEDYNLTKPPNRTRCIADRDQQIKKSFKSRQKQARATAEFAVPQTIEPQTYQQTQCLKILSLDKLTHLQRHNRMQKARYFCLPSSLPVFLARAFSLTWRWSRAYLMLLFRVRKKHVYGLWWTECFCMQLRKCT